MDLLYGHDKDVAEFVSRNLERECFPPYRAIGILTADGGLVGGMIFNDYNGSNIEIHIYTPGLWSRRAMQASLSYVFEELKCIRLTARVRRDNKQMCKILPRIGFDYEATLKQFFGPARGDDALIFRLTHEYASKWI